MFLPSVENRRYKAVADIYGEGVVAGEYSQVETNLYKFSTSLPRYKVGKYSRVLITGKPEIAAISLGDFAQVTIANPSPYNKDFLAVQGGDCCSIFITSYVNANEDMNQPAFTHADFEPVNIEEDLSPLYTGLRLIGDSFTARIQEHCIYTTKQLSLYLISHRGDLSLYMRDKRVFTLKPTELFKFDFGTSNNLYRSVPLEVLLYKQLKKKYFECRENQENQSCKSVVA